MAGPMAGMYAAIAGSQPMPTGEKFGPTEEMAYQKWKASLPQNLQYEGDYDLRGFYKQNPGFSVSDPTQHMTDEFKLPNHPTFSNESRYYTPATARMGGHWQGDVFVPNTNSKRRVDETPESMPADPRMRGTEFPPFYSESDYPSFYRSDVNRGAPPVLPFREEMQAGPAPPLGRLEMAYRSQRK